MNRTIETFRPYIIQADDQSPTSPQILTCMDDRPRVVPLDTVSSSIQLAGSSLGLSHGLYSATIIGDRKPDLSLHPTLDVVAKIISQTLGGHAIAVESHIDCKGEMAAGQINDLIANADGDKLLGNIQSVFSGATSEQVEKTILAAKLLREKQKIRNPKEAAQCMDTKKLYPEIPRVALLGEHVAEDIIFSLDPLLSFNNRAAHEAGDPAYFVSIGNIPELTGKLSDTFGVQDEEQIVVSSIAYHFMAAGLLPRPTNRELNIHVLPEAA